MRGCGTLARDFFPAQDPSTNPIGGATLLVSKLFPAQDPSTNPNQGAGTQVWKLFPAQDPSTLATHRGSGWAVALLRNAQPEHPTTVRR